MEDETGHSIYMGSFLMSKTMAGEQLQLCNNHDDDDDDHCGMTDVAG